MLTGSGVTLDALARHGATAGWKQGFVVGIPGDERAPKLGGPIEAVRFGHPPMPELVVGMSDVMPYESRTFSSLSEHEVEHYLDGFKRAIVAAIDRVEPDVIHSHHVWLMSSIVAELTDVPVVMHCHGTGLRQLELCPHLAERVARGAARNHEVLALHHQQVEPLRNLLGDDIRIEVVGAGFREEVFGGVHADKQPRTMAFAGKISDAKGLGPLLEAVAEMDDVTLHVAGGGEGAETERLKERMAELADKVYFHGRLDQGALAELLAHTEVFVLPSFYEGLPLVTIEALASGCRVVSTALPGVVSDIAPKISDGLELVDLPAMATIDTPVEDQIPDFTVRLRQALERALDAGPVAAPAVDEFTWQAVYRRVEAAWNRALAVAS
jgi:glycosyltransferase involved in cell wall biosynthesis